ncbi:MAG: TraR/DksA C4-type zinc finger protein [Bifidobacteriaceae bacterium]|nr:TraR/DksA C4-type zinc finger protein [Bifidobacteriaceae bacterium]
MAAKRFEAARIAAKLPVRDSEEPWTGPEVRQVRETLQADIDRLRTDLLAAEGGLGELLGDERSSGEDEVDTGTRATSREQSLAFVNNMRGQIQASELALERLESGTFGHCEKCGKPIGKGRLQAFPRATLCLEDKQREERLRA